ncbi:MAG: single-stranded DNA-binding protein, partial [Thiobacillus sp.]|nr:single-stranded DNA-binding protein [Thiobacillus sp.]
TEIRGDRMQMLGSKGGGMADMDDGGYSQVAPQAAPKPQARPSAPPSRPASSGFDDMEDDIPF